MTQSTRLKGQMLLTLLLLIASFSKAQTTLVAGDIAFSGYQSNNGPGTTSGNLSINNDYFSFVLLKNIASGTSISFTDNGWQRTSSTTGSFGTVEGTMIWTAGSALNAGTEVSVETIGTFDNVAGTGSFVATFKVNGTANGSASTSGYFSLSTSGDQVLAYQGLSSNPTFLAAIHMNIYVSTPTTTTDADWDGNIDVSANQPASGLPKGLTTGVNAIWINTLSDNTTSGESDNASFNCSASGVDLTTVSGLRTALNDKSKWNKNSNANGAAGSGNPAVTLPSGCSFLVATTTTWNGSTWSNGVPSSTVDAIIASSTAPASFTCKALTINSGVSLTTTGITATINGDITNNGNGIAGTGNIVVAANAALAGTAISFSGNLTVNSGATLTTNDKLTLSSDATNTGRVGNSAGTISGNVIVQRYIPGGRRVFRFLAHPFTSSLAMSSLTDNIDITGSGGAPFTTTTANAPSAFSYNNAIANSSLTADPGWTNLTAGSVFAAKTGYRILVRGTKGQTNSLNGGVYTPNAVTLDWTGTLNSGSQSFTLPYGGANQTYSLIGNPYACPVDLSLTTRGSNINANFSVWNAQAGSRGAYVTQAFSSSYVLPSGAAFFAQTSANLNNTITFDEADKVTTAPTSIFRTTSNEDKLVLELTDANNNYADQLIFYFDDKNKNYTASHDVLWDAEKLSNPDANLYSLSDDGKKLAIDRRPLLEQGVIPIVLTNTSPAAFTLLVKELPKVNQFNYYLKDNYLGTETLLTANQNIALSITSDAASQGSVRFQLLTKKQPIVSANASQFEVTLSPNPVKNILNVSYVGLDDKQQSTIRIVTIDGRQVANINLGNVQAGKYSINFQDLAKGLYVLHLENGTFAKTENFLVQ